MSDSSKLYGHVGVASIPVLVLRCARAECKTAAIRSLCAGLSTPEYRVLRGDGARRKGSETG